jgi:hypothetical protein
MPEHDTTGSAFGRDLEQERLDTVQGVVEQLGGSDELYVVPMHLQSIMDIHHNESIGSVHLYHQRPPGMIDAPPTETTSQAYAQPARPEPRAIPAAAAQPVVTSPVAAWTAPTTKIPEAAPGAPVESSPRHLGTGAVIGLVALGLIGTAGVGYKLASGSPKKEKNTADPRLDKPEGSGKVHIKTLQTRNPDVSASASVEPTPTPVETTPATEAPANTDPTVTAPAPPLAVPPAAPPTPETVTVPAVRFRSVNFNIEHIGNDSQAEWTDRMHKAINVIKGLSENAPVGAEIDPDKAADFATLQEVRPEQLNELKDLIGKGYDFYPNPANQGESYSPNIVIWRQTEWEKIKATGIDFKYFGGVKMIAPIVLLRHKETGQLMYVGSGHNPADTKLNGMHNEGLRHTNNDGYKRQLSDIEKASLDFTLGNYVVPIDWGIDGNERHWKLPGVTQNEPDGSQQNAIGCVLAGPEGMFSDAFAEANGMSKTDMCGLDGKPAPANLDPVDYLLFTEDIKQVGFDYSTPAADAGSDHKPEVQDGEIKERTLPISAQQHIESMKELAGASH